MPPKKTESEVAVFLKHVFLGVSIAAGLYAAIDQRISVAETRIEKRVEKNRDGAFVFARLCL